MNNSLITYFAAYDCAAYGAGDYNNTNCSTETAAANNSDQLSFTGEAFWIPVGLGIVIVVAAVILIAKRFLRKK